MRFGLRFSDLQIKQHGGDNFTLNRLSPLIPVKSRMRFA